MAADRLMGVPEEVTIVIGDRLKELRESKKLSHGDIESVQGCSERISPESKTDTPFLPLRPSKRWRVP
jgi:hypothetical protein